MAHILVLDDRALEAREIADRVGVRRVLAKPSELKDIVAAVAGALGESDPSTQPSAPGKRGAPEPEFAALAKGGVEQLDAVESLNLRLAGPDGLALVSTIITLAHALKLKVVAEDVETEEQSRLLQLLYCDEIQGYLFRKPVPAALFEAQFLAPASGA